MPHSFGKGDIIYLIAIINHNQAWHSKTASYVTKPGDIHHLLGA